MLQIDMTGFLKQILFIFIQVPFNITGFFKIKNDEKFYLKGLQIFSDQSRILLAAFKSNPMPIYSRNNIIQNN